VSPADIDARGMAIVHGLVAGVGTALSGAVAGVLRRPDRPLGGISFGHRLHRGFGKQDHGSRRADMR